jgi:hypothetical protein
MMVQATAVIPMVICNEHFGANNFTVTLEWFKDEVVFDNVHPPAFVRSVGNRSVQLTIPYNIENIASVAICGQPSPEAIKLYYSKSHHYYACIISFILYCLRFLIQFPVMSQPTVA